MAHQASPSNNHGFQVLGERLSKIVAELGQWRSNVVANRKRKADSAEVSERGPDGDSVSQCETLINGVSDLEILVEELTPYMQFLRNGTATLGREILPRSPVCIKEVIFDTPLVTSTPMYYYFRVTVDQPKLITCEDVFALRGTSPFSEWCQRSMEEEDYAHMRTVYFAGFTSYDGLTEPEGIRFYLENRADFSKSSDNIPVCPSLYMMFLLDQHATSAECYFKSYTFTPQNHSMEIHLAFTSSNTWRDAAEKVTKVIEACALHPDTVTLRVASVPTNRAIITAMNYFRGSCDICLENFIPAFFE